MTLAELHTGQSGTIDSVLDSNIKFKLMDMGCLPGEQVLLKFKAPLGDPICIGIAGYELILRKKEAASIQLTTN